MDADMWLYEYDALAEQGMEDDTDAWQALDDVKQLLARGRQTR